MPAAPEIAPARSSDQLRPSSDVAPWLGPALIILAALAVRAPFFAHTFFPLNDGGMFAQMSDDLRRSHLALPRETTYNFEHIPFCYPPLGFYLAALTQWITGAATLSILRWLPLLFNLATVAMLYMAALEMFGSRVTAFCAGLLYAALPRSAEWLTMGGGLTRSPAEFFVLLAVWCFWKARRTRHLKWAAVAGIAAGLAALTHLEAGVLVAVSLCVLALFTRSARLQIPDLLLAGTIAAAVAAPWFLWMLHVHGLAPFLAAFDTRGTLGSTATGVSPWRILTWMILAVPLWLLRQPPLTLWIAATEICVSRSALTHTAFIFSLLAALLLTAAASKLRPTIAPQLAICGTALLAVAMTAYYLPRHYFPHDGLRDLISDTRTTLTSDNGLAMQWVRDHVPPGTRFFVFNQRVDPWFGDLVGEWFPYLAQRESVYTAQGKEWLPGHGFQSAVAHIPTCQIMTSQQDLYSTVQPAGFDALFLTGPYDAEHARCASFLRVLPGFRLVFRRGENEVYLRTR